MIAGFLTALLTLSAPPAQPASPAAVSLVAVADDSQDTEAALYKAGRSSIDSGDWRTAEQAIRMMTRFANARPGALNFSCRPFSSFSTDSVF